MECLGDVVGIWTRGVFDRSWGEQESRMGGGVGREWRLFGKMYEWMMRFGIGQSGWDMDEAVFGGAEDGQEPLGFLMGIETWHRRRGHATVGVRWWRRIVQEMGLVLFRFWRGKTP